VIRDPLALALGSALAWISVALIAHLVVFRLVRIERRARTLVALFGAAAVAHLATVWPAGVDGWRAGYGLLLIGCAFICYMPFYYTVAASQSVQMLIALTAARDGLPADDLRRTYAVEEVFAGRLDTLVGAGYLERDTHGYALAAKGRLVARCFQVVRAVWNLGPGG
jgi:hypothetical protein